MKLGTNVFFLPPTFCQNEEFLKKLCCKIPVFAQKDCQISVFFLKIFHHIWILILV
jgi:hypothetical protein